MRFWDSSALVPLVVEQAGSKRADAWMAADSRAAIWTLTAVELSSALWRLVREGRLDDSSARQAEARAADFVAASHVVVDIETTKTVAQRLLRVHPLRAADALQLGAGLVWAANRPTGRWFHTLDERLATAARREGFDVG